MDPDPDVGTNLLENEWCKRNIYIPVYFCSTAAVLVRTFQNNLMMTEYRLNEGSETQDRGLLGIL